MVLANKQDLAQAMSVAEIHQALGLDALKNRTFQIFKTSALKGDGLDEAMEWLVIVSLYQLSFIIWITSRISHKSSLSFSVQSCFITYPFAYSYSRSYISNLIFQCIVDSNLTFQVLE